MARPTAHRWLLAGSCAGIVIALLPGSAAAGEYAVANCQADPLGFSTRAISRKNCGLRMADCGIKSPACLIPIRNPQSAIRNPQSAI